MLLKPTKTGDPKVDKALEEIRDAIKEPTRSHLYLFGNQNLAAAASVRYLHPGYEDAIANTGEKFQVALHDGRLENLRVSVQAGADTAGSLMVVVRVNEKDTTLSVQMESRAFGVFSSKPGRSVPVKAGDKIAVSVLYSAAPATAAANVVVNFELVY